MCYLISILYKMYNIVKFIFAYLIHNPGGERVFIGYVPTEEEMKQFLAEAGFENIEVRKWETGKGFHKITFVGEKAEAEP